MAEEDDAELERLAVEALLKDAKRGKERAATLGPSGWRKDKVPVANKRFLHKTLSGAVASHKRQESKKLTNGHLKSVLGSSAKNKCLGSRKLKPTSPSNDRHESDVEFVTITPSGNEYCRNSKRSSGVKSKNDKSKSDMKSKKSDITIVLD